MSTEGKRDYILIETGNYGLVEIELKELKDWIFKLSVEDLIRLDFTEKEHRKVKGMFLRNELRKTYSHLVYDFAVSMLNDMIRQRRVVFEKHIF